MSKRALVEAELEAQHADRYAHVLAGAPEPRPWQWRRADALEVLWRGRSWVLLFAGVNAPHAGQAYSARALAQVAEWTLAGALILLAPPRIDRKHGWLIASVGTERIPDLGAGLVERGLAWHTEHLHPDWRLATLQAGAKRLGLGLWSQRDPEAPWEYRKRIAEGLRQRRAEGSQLYALCEKGVDVTKLGR